jgi:hypothetical protein
VGVAPGAQVRVQPEVLVADVVAADPAGNAVDDHHLAVIAEVELEAVA